MTQEQFDKIIKEKGMQYRTCWNCNKAHGYLKEAEHLVFCLWCGRIYYKGVDVQEQAPTRKKTVSKPNSKDK